jgi:hypothetical protein
MTNSMPNIAPRQGSILFRCIMASPDEFKHIAIRTFTSDCSAPED